MTDNLKADVEAVGRVAAVPTILEVVCRVTGMGFAAVARVSKDRWIACAVRDEIAFGLGPGGELKVETTICDEIRDTGRAVIVDDAAGDEIFRSHPTPAMYGFRSYISVPIFRSGGRFFGTLCSIGRNPARLNRPEIVGMFRLFADLIAFHLDSQERVASSDATLSAERQTAELREEFIAVLGHDLRNPLASIDAGARVLSRELHSDTAAFVLKAIQASVKRMARLIDDVLDLARGRWGGGISVNRNTEVLLEAVLEQVVNELRAIWPGRVIETRFAIRHPIECDSGRIGQLLSNLVANALTHGATGGPVAVWASTGDHMLELAVANQGDPIPPTIAARLFQPFFRGSQRSEHEGLGLGLYIAREICVAHGGALDVVSSIEETRFIARIPAVQPRAGCDATSGSVA